MRSSKKVALLALGLLTLSVSGRGFAGEAVAPAAAWIPQEAIIVVEVAQPKALLDRLLDDRLVKTVQALPQYKEGMAKPEMQHVVNLVKYFEGRYNADLRTLLGKLTGGGITWAIGPQEASLVIVESEDAKMLGEIHEFFLLLARGEAQKKGNEGQITSAEYRGVTGWRFAPNEAHAIVGNRLLLTNKPEWLKAAADLRAEPNGASLAKVPEYQAAKKALSPNAVASVWANMNVLKQLPQLDKALTRNENPLAALLFTPLGAALRDSTWLTVGVGVQDKTFALEVAMDGAPSDASSIEGFATPESADGGAMPNLTVPRQVAAMSFYRDLHKFYAAKDELFPERTSGLIFFENMMGIFFTGRDLTEEVLAETGPEVRFVVAEQQYDPKIGTPRIQLPGFALVLPMRNPAKFAPVVEEAFQKGLGLINFTRGQQALPGMILDRPVHGDTKYTLAAFAPPDQADKTNIDIRFNFQTALAMPHGYLIISSTDALAKDLMDALKQETAGSVKPLAGTHTLITLDGSRLASLLRANRESMIQQNMVEKGHTHEQAEAELDMLFRIAERVSRVSLTAGSRGGQAQAKLEVTVDLP